MEITVEILVVATDYFGFILDPIVEPILAKFQSKKQQQLQQSPSALEQQQQQQGEQQQQRESVRFHGKGCKKGDSWVANIDRELRELCQFQSNHLEVEQANRDPLLRLLERTMESKWPWLSIERALQNPLDRRMICEDYDLCLVDDWDFPLLTPDFVEAAEGCQMKIVGSDPIERKFFIDIMTPQTAGPGSVESEANTRSFGETLCIKLLTKDEKQLQKERSNLIFYYSQIYPELSNLYSVVAKLLNSSELLETRTPSGGNQRLDRYTLIIMLAAYFSSPQAAKVQRDSKRHLLASHLKAFLSTFAYKHEPRAANDQQCGDCICIKPVRGEQGEKATELEISRLEAAGGDAKHLLVIDPAAKTDGCDKLTDNVPASLLFKVRGLFTDLHARLSQEAEGESAASEKVESSCSYGSGQDEINLFSVGNGDRTISAMRRPTLARLNFGGTKRSRQTMKLRVMHNLLCFAVFLLIRNQIVDYLGNWHSNLREKLRDDMTTLKHSLVNPAYAAETSNDAGGGGNDHDLSQAAESATHPPDLSATTPDTATPGSESDSAATTTPTTDPSNQDELWEGDQTVAQKAYDDSDEDEMPLEDLMRSLMQQALGENLGFDLDALLNATKSMGADAGGAAGDKAEILSQLSSLFASLSDPSKLAGAEQEGGEAEGEARAEIGNNKQDGEQVEATDSEEEARDAADTLKQKQQQAGQEDQAESSTPATETSARKPKDEL